MPSEPTRLECLRLAADRVGPAATHEQLFAEASRLLAFVRGFDEIVEIDGRQYAGKRL